ncbi:hypothetical protein FHG87_009563 [Trinorchestia longiramus]|nr:hypothetical protein FHG87_009563 [Trinorchestia longiramus]
MDSPYEDPSELLKITEIGPWTVKCRLPASQSTSCCILFLAVLYAVAPILSMSITTTGRNCCNCGGNHTANYGGCPKMKRAKEVEKTRQIQKLFNGGAVKQVLKQTATPLFQPQSVLPTNTTLSRHKPDSSNLQNLKTLKTKTHLPKNTLPSTSCWIS